MWPPLPDWYGRIRLQCLRPFPFQSKLSRYHAKFNMISYKMQILVYFLFLLLDKIYYYYFCLSILNYLSVKWSVCAIFNHNTKNPIEGRSFSSSNLFIALIFYGSLEVQYKRREQNGNILSLKMCVSVFVICIPSIT